MIYLKRNRLGIGTTKEIEIKILSKIEQGETK